MTKFVEVSRFLDPEEAYCANAYLQARGVESFLRNEHHLSVVPWLRIALGGYPIFCHESEYEKATHALELVNNSKKDTAVETEDKENRILKRNWLWLPMAFMSAVPFLPKYKTNWMFAVQGLALFFLYGMAVYFWIVY